MDVLDRHDLNTPAGRVAGSVEQLAHELYGSPRRAAVYVSSPITTGREFFELQDALGEVPQQERERLRARNTSHAMNVVERVRGAFPDDWIIEPLSLKEPDGWSQDHFNGFWMYVIHKYVKSVVLVDGWEYSTGCSWELSQALRDRLPILDEKLAPLSAESIVKRLDKTATIVRQQPAWSWARKTALNSWPEGSRL